jgi:hypothetical protein
MISKAGERGEKSGSGGSGREFDGENLRKLPRERKTSRSL